MSARGCDTIAVMAMTGVTKRQIEFWCAKGLVKPLSGGGIQGAPRIFSFHEVRVIRRMVRLASYGIPLKDAARAARSKNGRIQLAPGIWLSIRDID